MLMGRYVYNFPGLKNDFHYFQIEFTNVCNSVYHYAFVDFLHLYPIIFLDSLEAQKDDFASPDIRNAVVCESICTGKFHVSTRRRPDFGFSSRNCVVFYTHSL